MAQKVLTIRIDDLDGKELKADQGETVTFALDDTTYEIDLSKKNAAQLRAAFEPYIESGRKSKGKKTTPRAARTQSGPSAKEIRDWARDNGIEVPDRGRVPETVKEQFNAR